MAYPCYAWSAATPLILSRRAATRQPQAATPVEPSLADTRPRLALRYHRAMSYGGFNFFQKVTMPDYCPPYYWLDASRLVAHARAQLPRQSAHTRRAGRRQRYPPSVH